MAKIPKSTSYDSVNTPPLLSSTWTRLDEQEGEELEGAGSDSEWEADEVSQGATLYELELTGCDWQITSLTLDFGELSAQALEQHHSLQLLVSPPGSCWKEEKLTPYVAGRSQQQTHRSSRYTDLHRPLRAAHRRRDLPARE